MLIPLVTLGLPPFSGCLICILNDIKAANEVIEHCSGLLWPHVELDLQQCELA